MKLGQIYLMANAKSNRTFLLAFDTLKKIVKAFFFENLRLLEVDVKNVIFLCVIMTNDYVTYI